MHLGELASVRSGLVLARKESREPTPYCYNLLTLRSIHPDGSIAQEDLSVFHASEPLKAEYLTQPGDIIVRLTTPYTAILIDSNHRFDSLLQFHDHPNGKQRTVAGLPLLVAEHPGC